MIKNSIETHIGEKREKPVPAFLCHDYPYNATGESITDLDNLVPNGVLYEIECPECDMSIRGQGVRIKKIYSRLLDGIEVQNEDGSVRIEGGKGCVGCGNRNLIVRMIDMSRLEEIKAN